MKMMNVLSFLPQFRFICVILLCTTVLGFGYSQSQERDLEVYPYWKYYSNVSNTLYEILAERAFEQLKDRKAHINTLQSRSDWQNRQKKVKSVLAEIVGAFPEKTPLNPVITEKMSRDGIVVEKLYFESRPEYYVTAIFTYPENFSGPLPAILFCSGHAAEGFRSETYQHMIFNYVKKGFAVLAFDPIGQGERIRYLDQEGHPRLSPTKEHSYPGSQSFLAGISPAHYFIWDGIRSVDYLLSREEVDPDRIGITGRSGGGTQTAYIAAMDDRIYAAAPECYITTFDKLLRSNGPQDAEQNLIREIASGIDLADFIEVRAPKPTLIVSTTRDIFSIQGVRDVYEEALPAFSALGAPQHLLKVEDDAPHASTVKNREATYAFFQEHLGLPGPTADEKVPVFTPEELWVLPTGNVYRDLGGEDIYSLTLKDMGRKEVQEELTGAVLRSKVIELSGYESKPANPDVVFSGRTVYDSYSVEKYLIKGNDDYRLPLVWMKPDEPTGQTILWLDDQGKGAYSATGSSVDRWLDAGYSIVLPDLSGMGELGNGYPGGDARIQNVPLNIWYAGILTNRSISAVHGEELVLVRQFILNEMEDDGTLILMARGAVGTELLQVAFIEGWPDKLILTETLHSFRSILDDREYDARFLMSAVPGSLYYYDVPDLIREYGKTSVLMVDPVDGSNRKLSDVDGVSSMKSRNADERFEIIRTWLD